MVRAIKNMLARIRNGRAYRDAAEARREALAAVADAKRRGDTRDLHAAYQRVRAATHSALRVELAR